MIQWMWFYWNKYFDNKEKDIQILRLQAQVQRLEGVIASVKYAIDNTKDE